MGDPLSTAASVAGVISLGLQSVEYLYRFYSAYRDQHQELARIADKLGDLLGSLQNIQQIVNTRQWRLDEQALRRSIETSVSLCHGVVNNLKEETDKFRKEPGDDWKRKIVVGGRRAAYPFKQDTLHDLGEDVDSFRGNLAVALQVLGLKEHQNTQKDIQAVTVIVTSTQQEVQVVADIVTTIQAHHLRADLCQWLKAPDASVDFNTVCSKRHAGTGQWLVQGAAFTRWLSQDNSFLWLYGFAGCGKSVLCSTAIQQAFRQQRAQPGRAIAFFFFTFRDEAKQDASAMLRALLLQLAGQVPGLEAELSRLQESYKHAIPPVSVLIEYLRQAVQRSQQIYILLDALDESPVKTARKDVLSTIRAIRGWQLPGLHLLVTSRDSDALDIRDSISNTSPNDPASYIPLRNTGVQDDISHHISWQMTHDQQLLRWTDQQRETITDYLGQRADGVFRWVDLQLFELREIPCSDYHLDECLHSLPEDLDQTYEAMLSKISSLRSKQFARQLLSLLCFAARPLSIDEVLEALAVDLTDQERYDGRRRLRAADDLVRICPGLIDVDISLIDSDRDPEDTAWKRTVRIAHFSVQEYLLSDRIRRSCVNDFALSGPSQHGQLSKACLLYLPNPELTEQPLGPDLIQRYALAPYAARYWHAHYRQADAELRRQLLKYAVTLLIAPATFKLWTRLYDPDRPWRNEVKYDKPGQTATPTYCAALLGLEDVLTSILSQDSSDVNALGGDYGSALQAASAKGHLEVVQLLLEKGAEVNAVGGEYGSALQAASAKGHLEVVQLLQKHGAVVEDDNNHEAEEEQEEGE